MNTLPRMILGLDIDGTITAAPDFFRMLAAAVYRDGGKVIVISARINTAESRRETETQLRGLGLLYSKLILLPEGTDMLGQPPPELDYFDRYLWQKVHISVCENVRVFFDDDDTVVDLFTRYAPYIQIYQSIAPVRWP